MASNVCTLVQLLSTVHFFFNVGQQLFSVIIFAISIVSRKRCRAAMFSPLIRSTKYLTWGALAYILAEYTYFIAFTITHETSILLALDNLSISITLVFFLLLP